MPHRCSATSNMIARPTATSAIATEPDRFAAEAPHGSFDGSDSAHVPEGVANLAENVLDVVQRTLDLGEIALEFGVHGGLPIPDPLEEPGGVALKVSLGGLAVIDLSEVVSNLREGAGPDA